jgi:hypothetical protein
MDCIDSLTILVSNPHQELNRHGFYFDQKKCALVALQK